MALPVTTTTAVNMFEAGAAMAQEAARAEQCRLNEETHQELIQHYVDKFNVNKQDATAIADFRDDILLALLHYADTANNLLFLNHIDGSATTREEQFDLMIMASIPEYRQNICGVYLGPSEELFYTADPILTTIENTKYMRVESLKEARRVLIEDPTCSRFDKDCAIRQIYDEFVRGFNNDPEVEGTISDEIEESLWKVTVFARPSNEKVARELVLAHHLTQTQ
jgi:hypothetical protein